MARLYRDLAELWPLLSPPADYALEARHAWRLLRPALPPRGRGRRPRLLELGCGGGHLLSHLASAFEAVALDRSPPMLALSRRLNPAVEHWQGDMRSARLGQHFDAVLIGDAIDYMLSEPDLRAAFATAAAHLRPGGVLLLLPDYLRETFPHHQASAERFRGRGLQGTCVSYVFDPDPGDTTYQLVMLWLLRRQATPARGRAAAGGGAGVRVAASGHLRIEEDRHTCGLFPLKTWLRLLRREGFAPSLHPRERQSQREQPGLAPAILCRRGGR